MWETKAKQPTPIFSVRSPKLFRGSVMLDCRCWILGFPGSLSSVVQMDIRMLSMYSFAYSLSDIHLHTSMITCLVFVFISWASFFSIFSRYR